MGNLQFTVLQKDGKYEAICIDYPHITWIADTEEDALEGAQEVAYQYHSEISNEPNLWQPE